MAERRRRWPGSSETPAASWLLPLVDITLDNIPRSRAPGDQDAVAADDVVDDCHVVAGMIAAVALGDPSS